MKYKLKDLGVFKNGANFPKGSYGEGIKIVNVKDLFPSHFINYSELSELKNGVLKNQAQYLLQHGDLLFTRSSLVQSGTGMCAMIEYPEESIIFCGFIIRFRPNMDVVNPYFLVYLLRSQKYRQMFIQFAAQTTITNLNQKSLGEIEVDIPSMEQQEKVANTLKSFDDKIIVNKTINRKLDQQAHLIFDEWFGGYFGKSSVPAGWSEKELGDMDVLITDYVANGSFKALADNVQYLDVETNNVLIRLTDYNNNYSSDMVYISDDAYEFLAKSKLFGDEIIISNVGANVGTVFRCPRLEKRMSLGPNAILLRSTVYGHYLYLLFSGAYGQYLLSTIVTGSAQPKFNKTNFRSLKIVVPDTKTLEKFNAIYSPVFEQITLNNIENTHLANARNTLIPHLMFGELDLTGIDL